MYLLGIDLETTGLDSERDQIIEVGAVVWDSISQSPIEMFSKLIQAEGLILPKHISDLTGITDSQIENFGSPLANVIDDLRAMGKKCDFLVGHNSLVFDRKFLSRACKDLKKPALSGDWIDTIIDVNFNPSIKTRKLSYLAAEHNITNQESHRAVFDVLTMFKIMSKYDIDEICRRAATPIMNVIAKVSIENKDKAAEYGFRWNPQAKIWYKLMRQYDVEKVTFPFGVSISRSEVLD